MPPTILPAVICVDQLSDDGRQALIRTPRLIYDALHILQPDLTQQLARDLTAKNESAYAFSAGRYVAVLTASLDNASMRLLFTDFQKDPWRAKRLAAGLDDPALLMTAFYENLSCYDEDHDGLTLTLLTASRADMSRSSE